MIGWIVYNGALENQKITNLIDKLYRQSIKRGLEMYAVKNNALLPLYESSEPKLESTQNIPLPDFVIFWDKDIFLARHLERMGIRLFNSANAIALCDDKALMMLELAKSGLRTPKTIVAPFTFSTPKIDEEYIQAAVKCLGMPIIVKESCGSFGQQVYKAESKEELLERLIALGDKRTILQEYIQTSCGRDIRVNIIGDRVVGAMLRSNDRDFRANITLGGKGTPIPLTDEQEEIALAAHQLLGLDFSGVDLLFGKNDEPILCEVNSNVNFLSFEAASGIDFGELLLDDILEKMR